MDDYTDMPIQEITPEKLVVLDVEIWSRHGYLYEMLEMINFVKYLNEDNITKHVKTVFYDSKVSICYFDLDEKVEQDQALANRVLFAAKNTISQFNWFDCIDHGVYRRKTERDSIYG